jgi:predicted transcriptional regulator
MRKKRKLVQPSDAEMEILNILWVHGPCTVRLVNDELNKIRPLAYTTTLKTMQVMMEKGFLRRDDSQRSHLYTASLKENETKQARLDRFIKTTFAGSTSHLVMQALGHHQASKEELAKIRAYLDQLEEGKDDTAK